MTLLIKYGWTQISECTCAKDNFMITLNGDYFYIKRRDDDRKWRFHLSYLGSFLSKTRLSKYELRDMKLESILNG